MSGENGITIISPRGLVEARELSTTLSKATLLPPALRGKEADVLMTIMAGAELGLGPIQSIRSIHIIEGKPTLSSDLIAALCLRSPDVCEYLQPTESTPLIATYVAKRKGSPSPVTMSFSIEEAKLAGLAGRGNWAKYPKAMLRARCISAICRAVFPDLVGGLYDSDSDEIEAPTPRDVTASVIDSVATPLPTPPPAKARRMLIVEEPAAASNADTVETLSAAIESAGTRGALESLVGRIAARKPEEKDVLRPAYEARLKAVAK